jgi:multiple sugar transport system substrate-binding protein
MTFTSRDISRRSFLIGGLAAVSVPLLLSGCAPSSAPQGQGALRVAWWGGEARTAKMNEILAMYEAEKDVAFRAEFADYFAYWERFATQAAAKNLPDLVSMTEQQVGEFASILHDLQPAVDSGDLDVSSWEQRYLDAGTVDGRLVQLFLGGTIPSQIFNRPALTAAGYSGDPNEWSWAEFRDACLDIAGKGGGDTWATDDAGGVSQQFDTFLHQRGKAIVVGDGLGWEPADLEEYLTAWAELRDAGATPPIDVSTENYGSPIEDRLIVRGQVVFHSTNHNQVPALQLYMDDELGYSTLPVFSGGQRAAINAGTYVSVTADSQNIDTAIDYLNWFVNTPEVITTFQAEYGGLPSPEAAEILAPELSEPARAGLEYYASVESFADIVPVWPSGALRLIQLVRESNENVAFGATPAEAATECYEQSTAAIA